MRIQFTCPCCGKHFDHSQMVIKVSFALDGHAPIEATVDGLVNDMLTQDEDVDLGGEQELVESRAANGPASTMTDGAHARLAPSKPAPGKASPNEKTSPHERTTPAAKTKPKQADTDDAVPAVPRKYWIILSVLLAILGVTWVANGYSRPDPNRLAATIMSPVNKPEDRLTACLELLTFDSPEVVEHMERIVKQCNDPQVVTRVIPMLVQRKPVGETRNLLLDALDHPQQEVREAAFEGFQRMMTISDDEKAGYKADDPAERRRAAAQRLKEKYRSEFGRILEMPKMSAGS